MARQTWPSHSSAAVMLAKVRDETQPHVHVACRSPVSRSNDNPVRRCGFGCRAGVGSTCARIACLRFDTVNGR